MVSGAGVAPAMGVLGSNMKLVGYGEGSHLSSLWVRGSPQVHVGDAAKGLGHRMA